MEKEKFTEFNETQDRRIEYCTWAPEWAEHGRFHRDDEPCDDGRIGNICGDREGEDACSTS